MKNLLHSTEITTRHGRWFAMRLMPDRTMDTRIGGVATTFTDITVAKQFEAKLRAVARH